MGNDTPRAGAHALFAGNGAVPRGGNRNERAADSARLRPDDLCANVPAARGNS